MERDQGSGIVVHHFIFDAELDAGFTAQNEAIGDLVVITDERAGVEGILLLGHSQNARIGGRAVQVVLVPSA